MANIIKMPERKGVRFEVLRTGQAFIQHDSLFIKTASRLRATGAMRLVDGQHYNFADHVLVQPVDLEILVKE